MRHQEPVVNGEPIPKWPEDGIESVAECPACGSTRRSVLHDQLRDVVFRCAPGLWRLDQCSDCGTAYLPERPTQESMHLAYSHYYTHHTEGGPPPASTFVRRLKKSLSNGYQNYRYGSSRQPAMAAGQLLNYLPITEAIDRKWRCLPKRKGRLLDFGCGDGSFVERAKEIGWEIVATELDPVCVDNGIARGLNIKLGGTDVLGRLDESFDVVTCSHVIEHVPEPAGVICEFFRVLRPGGMLYLDTPNIDAYGHTVYGRHWRGLEVPRHLTLFNWRSLEQLTQSAGFRSISRHVQHAVFREMMAKSSLIRDGLDGEAPALIKAGPKPSILRRLIQRCRPSTSEFVTFTAIKPKDTRD